MSLGLVSLLSLVACASGEAPRLSTPRRLQDERAGVAEERGAMEAIQRGASDADEREELSHVRRPLVAQSDGKFTIVQFADLHFDEQPSLWWGPSQDRKSVAVMDTILALEDQADLVVFTGDQITTYRQNATRYWDMLTGPVRRHNKPFAMVFGNHDDSDEPFRHPPHDDLSRRMALLQYDMSLPGSLTESMFVSSMAGGVTNYVLEVYRSDIDAARGQPAALLWFLDSGGGSIKEIIREDQVRWFSAKAREMEERYGVLPAFLYMHIPCKEYTYSTPNTLGPRCFGMIDDEINPTEVDTGVFAAAVAAHVQYIFVGHDHGNDYCCPIELTTPQQPSSLSPANTSGPFLRGEVTLREETTDSSAPRGSSIMLCFGRHTGYGGYGKWARGARLLQIDLSDPSFTRTKTWVRMEDGSSSIQASQFRPPYD
ncbi:unnamed protein product [Vitrella brassicaformis CCMP3155]|uniref:Calcineurin-like phosphoesterase domain-containing protein n=1 Tax=Vitrella brassicaformis (strain CCMP3155) TaxID=1169540 RepID=A0A0G4EJY5_VITBC|nr:unnamed protein product [Vitrella brassicaformis CCMP3155]|eukprot:CEL96852.1 unnamed protein product [Vitrella brassicaformis CCMP3155]